MSGASPGLWHPALLALLPLTGFLVFHSDREELPWPARTALGTAWVISLLTIAVFLLHLVEITPSAVRILFIAIPAVALLRRRARIFGRPAGLSGRESLWLALALIAVAALAFGPHFSYRFPLHADEFWHAAFANKIIETRHLFFDPNLSMRIVHAETGFHALLAGILLLTGLDPLPSCLPAGLPPQHCGEPSSNDKRDPAHPDRDHKPMNCDLPSQEEADCLQQGKQRKEHNSDRGKRFHVFSLRVGTSSVSKLTDGKPSAPAGSSGNHAPTPMGNTLRGIKSGGIRRSPGQRA